VSRIFSLVLICLLSAVGCSEEAAKVAESSIEQESAAPTSTTNITSESSGEVIVDKPLTLDVYTDFI